MHIASDGTWYYMGTPIHRERLVRLFASILRREDDGNYSLVTPVERYGIEVEDAPFTAVAMTVTGMARGQTISFRTNVGDEVTIDEAHPLRFATTELPGELRPYALVRERLEALVSRPVFYDLVELGTTHGANGDECFGVWSGGVFFAMASAADLDL